MRRGELIETYRMVGESEAFLDCMERVSKVANVDRPVLILGERGTGKELVAARLHYLSARWDMPRISLNCASFAPELLASELFGYEPGAFTGAVKRKPGRFELANRGTLFLDELAQSPKSLQEKILRVLEYQEFERVGGVETIKVDTRVIAATNANLLEMCEAGEFRMDLLDRLSFEVIHLPPLRFREGDIPVLARFFARKMALELGYRDVPTFHAKALDKLMNHGWPGNIRELKNVVERCVYRSGGETMTQVELNPFENPYDQSAPTMTPEVVQEWPLDLNEKVLGFEKSFVQAALERNQFHQARAAEDLKLGYHQFRRLIKKHEL